MLSRNRGVELLRVAASGIEFECEMTPSGVKLIGYPGVVLYVS
jgi:hypothetical protein